MPSAISLLAYDDLNPAKCFVKVPNEKGRWMLTDKSVIEVPCPWCLSTVGEPCHNANRYTEAYKVWDGRTSSPVPPEERRYTVATHHQRQKAMTLQRRAK